MDEERAGEAQNYCVHPALSDAALHVGLLASEGQAEVEVPFSFAGVRLFGRGAGVCGCAWAGSAMRVRVPPRRAFTPSTRRVTRCSLFEGLRTQAIDLSQLQGAAEIDNRSDALYELGWAEIQAPVIDGAGPRIVVLEPQGAASTLLPVGLESHSDLAALEDALGQGAPMPAVVLLNISTMAAQTDGGGWVDGVEREGLGSDALALTTSVLEILQAWAASERLLEARLLVITEGALATEREDTPNLLEAALVGLLRSAHSEHPERFGLLDLDGSQESTAALLSAVVINEPEIAVRKGRLLVPRIARAGTGGSLLVPEGGGSAWHVGTDAPGTLESLALAQVSWPGLARGGAGGYRSTPRV